MQELLPGDLGSPRYEVLIDDVVVGEELPDSLWPTREQAKREADELAEYMSEGGHTGRVVVRELRYDALAIYSVKVRGLYKHVEDYDEHGLERPLSDGKVGSDPGRR